MTSLSNKYDEWHLHQFATGICYIAGIAFDDDTEAMKEAWEQLREPFMEVWKVEFPGTRPWVWWELDAPERRLRIDGKQHPFDNPEREDKRLYYGKPTRLIGKDEFMAEYEGELEYLLRLRLIEPEEVKKFQEKPPPHHKARIGAKIRARMGEDG
mgnify:CR=1 FL=1|jgi:hypothetical protein|tara:strand:- start:64 stop:528 length:465 start_codon:yes stop_codon:yes gene_type:complete